MIDINSFDFNITQSTEFTSIKTAYFDGEKLTNYLRSSILGFMEYKSDDLKEIDDEVIYNAIQAFLNNQKYMLEELEESLLLKDVSLFCDEYMLNSDFYEELSELLNI